MIVSATRVEFNPVKASTAATTGFSLPNSQTSHKTARKGPDFLDKAYEIGNNVFEYADEAVGLVGDAADVVKEFSTSPSGLDEFLVAAKSFKIIKGVLAVPDLVKGAIKVITAEKLKDKLFGGWSIIKAAKKIVGAVETIFYYLSKLNVISKAATAWTTITGYVFMPIAFIQTGISAYELGKKVKFMNSFRQELKLQKQTGSQKFEDIVQRSVTYILTQKKALRKIEVITKSCPLKDRLNGILARLKSDNAEIRAKAAEEGKMIKKRLKDRISEQVGIAAVGTTLSTAGVASTIIGLACPPAAPGLAILGLVLTVVGIANLAYSKIVPQGDIFDTEKRMLFSSIRKATKVAIRAIKASCVRFTDHLRMITHKIAQGLSIKVAAQAA